MLPSPTTAAPAPLAGALLTPEAVDVRTERVADGVEVPAQLLRRGRLWVVRGARLLDRGTAQEERWRVQAGDGPGGRLAELDLVRSPAGGWRLSEVAS